VRLRLHRTEDGTDGAAGTTADADADAGGVAGDDPWVGFSGAISSPADSLFIIIPIFVVMFAAMLAPPR